MFKKIAVVVLVALVAVGCSRTTVPPASKGKILSAQGYSEQVLETGKYWLAWWNNLVILDTSTKLFSESLTIKMSDDLDLPVVVRFRTRIQGNDQVINAMFNDLKHEDYHVTLDKVYATYGKDVVQNATRSVISKYKVKDVSKNYELINRELAEELTKRMKGSPLEVSNITIADISWPKLITEAIEKQQSRELDIQTEENNQAVEMVKKTNELLLAKADYEIRMERARAIRDENKVTAEGLNPILLAYRKLEVLEAMTNNQNAVFVPYDSINDVGVSNRMYSK